MIRASIDLGTNTCLLLIAEWNPKLKVLDRVLGDYARVVRLGEGVDHLRRLQQVPMERTFHCLRDYAEKVRDSNLDPADVVCVATSQARDAANSREFFSEIARELGFAFHVLSGEQEAQATFLGALLPGMDPAQSRVIDIGGGSTEIISAEGKVSIDVGSVRFTERFLKSDPVTDEEFWECEAAIDSVLNAVKDQVNQTQFQRLGPLLAVAGTATSLAAWHLGLTEFDAQRVDSAFLSRGDVHRMVEELKWRTRLERQSLPCMDTLRSDVILAGALILWRVMEIFEVSQCRVSSRGLRFGALLMDSHQNVPSTLQTTPG